MEDDAFAVDTNDDEHSISVKTMDGNLACFSAIKAQGGRQPLFAVAFYDSPDADRAKSVAKISPEQMARMLPEFMNLFTGMIEALKAS